MWKRFMIEAHAYLQLPPRPFEKPDDVVTSSCGGHEEVFKVDSPTSKPGACKSPARAQGDSSTPPPAPRVPVFPPRTAEPTPPPPPPPSPPPPAPAPARTPFQYTVQEGDSVQSIAQKFSVSEKDLRQANGLKPNDTVKPGDKLTIPA